MWKTFQCHDFIIYLDIKGSLQLAIILLLAQPAFTVEDILVSVRSVRNLHSIQEPVRRKHSIVMTDFHLIHPTKVHSLNSKSIRLQKVHDNLFTTYGLCFVAVYCDLALIVLLCFVVVWYQPNLPFSWLLRQHWCNHMISIEIMK